MKLSEFKKLYKKYSVFPLPKEVAFSEEYDQYSDAIEASKECRDWYLKQEIKDAGINYKKYCCLDMAYHMIESLKKVGPDEINYDAVITYNKSAKQFGIPIHDGGASWITIHFCPWCATDIRNWDASVVHREIAKEK